EGGEAGEFPADGDEEEVAGEDERRHRPHEEEEEGVEASHGVVGVQVVARVDDDEDADPEDEEGEEEGEPVEPDYEVEPEGRQPGMLPGRDGSRPDRGEVGEEEGDRPHRWEGGGDRAPPSAAPPVYQRRDEGAEEGEEQDDGERCWREEHGGWSTGNDEPAAPIGQPD